MTPSERGSEPTQNLDAISEALYTFGVPIVQAINLNSVVEDTSVLVAGAFLLVRTRVGRFVVRKELLGAIFGIVAFTEVLAPDARFPYATHTLACFVAAIYGGLEALTAATLIATILAIASGLTRKSDAPWLFIGQIALVGFVGLSLKKSSLLEKIDPIRSVAFMVATQALAILMTIHSNVASHAAMVSFWTIPANGLGMMLISLVLRDAMTREEADRLKHDASESKRVAAEAQLASLRSRIQPHFLLNALNTIAALCDISPERASRATVGLGDTLRRLLEMDHKESVPVSEEIIALEGYIRIEKERFGDRIIFQTRLDNSINPLVPPFSLQILVENAILHGLTPSQKGGIVEVETRRIKGGSLVAVRDNGVGFSSRPLLNATSHGLGILNTQLKMISGEKGRLRFLSNPGRGTQATFFVKDRKTSDQND